MHCPLDAPFDFHFAIVGCLLPVFLSPRFIIEIQNRCQRRSLGKANPPRLAALARVLALSLLPRILKKQLERHEHLRRASADKLRVH